MMLGLIALMSSRSIFSRDRDLGRKFVTNTSARATSFSRTTRAPGFSSASPMLRLPRLGASMMGKNAFPLLETSRPSSRISPRWASPYSACSTLITSAPQSARTAPEAGTKVYWATSSTRTPSIGRAICAASRRATSVPIYPTGPYGLSTASLYLVAAQAIIRPDAPLLVAKQIQASPGLFVAPKVVRTRSLSGGDGLRRSRPRSPARSPAGRQLRAGPETLVLRARPTPVSSRAVLGEIVGKCS
ncbi:hypothetical protein FRAHR75_170062 [Frankia sp. Hr75.2]|nr:hypothetical protein FRAHR75_170062 [Frankia sp. Hr75.2]